MAEPGFEDDAELDDALDDELDVADVGADECGDTAAVLQTHACRVLVAFSQTADEVHSMSCFTCR